ncbi:hypothetical protein [Vibrio phage S4-7]|nr:hypothetical protein [Vibrio phage S4-7]
MKTYIFKVQQSSDKRGYNRTVYVYRMKNNQPIFVGYDEEINTASYKGDRAIAAKIISENDKMKMDRGGYNLESKNVQIFEI